MLEDYNYFINKAILQYINKMYNAYDINQQKTDDLRVLKSTAVLEPKLQTVYPGYSNPTISSPLYMATYEVDLPPDYVHMLNCIIEYKLQKSFKCYNIGSYVQFGTKRLTGDMQSQIINNYYMRPTYNNPYYYIHNVNTVNTFPTEDSKTILSGTNFNIYTISLNGTEVNNDTITINGVVYTLKTSPSATNPLEVAINTTNNGTLVNLYAKLAVSSDPLIQRAYYYSDINTNVLTIKSQYDTFVVSKSNVNGVLTFEQVERSLINREEDVRYGNRDTTRMELRFGKDDKVFKPTRVYVDYLKAPQFVRLTQEQIDAVEDTSQILEFPDYVIQEIINELVKILMENSSDPRLQTHIPINTSIAGPSQGKQ